MTTNALVYEGADLPPRIQRSIARALDPRFPIELTPPERVALAALLRRVEARDGRSAFWVRRVNLGELFGRVERTVSNWLASLESKGLIQKEQGRTRWGNFSCVTLHLTELATSLLGLSPSADEQRKKSSAGHKEALPSSNELQSFQRHPQADLSTGQSSRKHGVPADCEPLLELGLRPSGVFKLMKIATARGKRLGDVVTARLKAIKAARRPFGLLQQLCSDDVDYRYVRQAEVQEETTRAAVDERRSLVKRARERLDGQFVRVSSTARIRFSRIDIPQVFKLDERGKWTYAYALAGPQAIETLERAEREGWMPEG